MENWTEEKSNNKTLFTPSYCKENLWIDISHLNVFGFTFIQTTKNGWLAAIRVESFVDT